MGSPKNIGRPLSFATSRAALTRRQRAASVGPWARSRAASHMAADSFGSAWNGAESGSA